MPSPGCWRRKGARPPSVRPWWRWWERLRRADARSVDRDDARHAGVNGTVVIERAGIGEYEDEPVARGQRGVERRPVIRRHRVGKRGHVLPTDRLAVRNGDVIGREIERPGRVDVRGRSAGSA